jgi:hypothetical protein
MSINSYKEFGAYANLAHYNGPFGGGYVQLPVHYGEQPQRQQSVVPDFGTFGYTSLTRGIVIPNNYPSMNQAYGKNAANCGLFNTY